MILSLEQLIEDMVSENKTKQNPKPYLTSGS